MSNPTQMSPASRFPKVPEGDTVASYASYEEAQKSVDRLARNEGFSVQAISIVGSDLKSVERVTGRMNSLKAALNGAVSGLFLGMFVSAVFMLFDPNAQLLSMLGVLLLATVFGAVWGLILYAISPNKREFASMMQLTATRYDLVVPRSMSGEARRILGTAWQPSAQQAPDTQQPAREAPVPGAGGYGQPIPPYGQTSAQPGVGPHPGRGGHPVGDAQAPAAPPAEGEVPAPPQPATPPRTYGEMLDEQRRREREAAGGAADADSEGDDAAR